MVERPGHFQKPEAASAQCLIYLLWGSWPSLFTAGSPLQRLRKQGSVLCSQKLTRRVCCNGAALNSSYISQQKNTKLGSECLHCSLTSYDRSQASGSLSGTSAEARVPRSRRRPSHGFRSQELRFYVTWLQVLIGKIGKGEMRGSLTLAKMHTMVWPHRDFFSFFLHFKEVRLFLKSEYLHVYFGHYQFHLKDKSLEQHEPSSSVLLHMPGSGLM